MIHDTARVDALRARAAAQIELINTLEAKIVKGKLDMLAVGRRQTEDIETFFLRDLERQDRTPVEESRWLSSAEYMLGAWAPYLQEKREQFSKHQTIGIEIFGG